MKIKVITLFPELLEAVTRSGMPRVAVEQNALELSCINPRDFAQNKWRKVDERPFGGGPGMVMQAEPLAQSIEHAKSQLGAATQVVMMSPQGERMNQAWFERLSREAGLIVLCGRYEGVDERLVAAEVDVELSLGDFVLSGGELAAMVLIDGIARLLPGVLGHAESAGQDSFSNGLLDHPHYSRPEVWREQAVPEVLMSGNHAHMARWRLKQALGRTWLRRPDLLEQVVEDLDAERQELLREVIAEFIAEHKVGGS
ncbi:MAG: tRNA (guanosine(37)-N1)-methyltransferase TrmD [Panacagrimonas sp.]